mgnify:CR=1 FL=1
MRTAALMIIAGAFLVGCPKQVAQTKSQAEPAAAEEQREEAPEVKPEPNQAPAKYTV